MWRVPLLQQQNFHRLFFFLILLNTSRSSVQALFGVTLPIVENVKSYSSAESLTDEYYSVPDYGEVRRTLRDENGKAIITRYDYHASEKFKKYYGDIIQPPPTSVSPSIAKCCQLDEVLQDMRCRKASDSDMASNTSWYPPKFYNYTVDKFMEMNISDWNVTAPFRINCSEDKRLQMVPSDERSKFVLTALGGLLLTREDPFIPPNEFCVDRLEEEPSSLAILTCITPEKSRRLRKCCPLTTMVEMHGENLSCFIPEKPRIFYLDYELVHGPPDCPFEEYVTNVGEEALTVEEDGTLSLQSPLIRVDFNSYCMDYFQEDDGETEVQSMKILMCLQNQTYLTDFSNNSDVLEIPIKLFAFALWLSFCLFSCL